MDTITLLNIVLRLAIWFLLTNDFSVPNIIIGVAIALLLPLPRRSKNSATLNNWIRVFWEIIIAIPQAYIEAIQIMLLPHNYERTVRERVKPNRSPGLIFLDIFIITFTPKTIVTEYQEAGWYKVHYVRWKKPKRLNHE